ncbi:MULTISPECIES: hypothetical protein [unclassified Roseibium]|uniref:hypothetical protein n=1 Tax=unclassified Roseibium TaxID=2629323 RepID=UPI00273E245E|nr:MULTISPECIES: hypothetical protein [unclassified Roseibium]
MEWRTDIENAPGCDGEVHLRGVWVVNHINKTPSHFEMNSGHINDAGEFVSQSGDEFGWRADDYTHWSPLPEIPPFQPVTQ